MNEIGILQRAFELAAQGTRQFEKLRKALKKEGFTEASIEQHLGGRGIRKQLRDAYMPAPEADQPGQQDRL